MTNFFVFCLSGDFKASVLGDKKQQKSAKTFTVNGVTANMIKLFLTSMRL